MYLSILPPMTFTHKKDAVKMWSSLDYKPHDGKQYSKSSIHVKYIYIVVTVFID